MNPPPRFNVAREPNSPVRIGIVGLGAMGAAHARLILDAGVPGLQLTAVADTDSTRLKGFADLPGFKNPSELITSELVEAALICTPHFAHTSVGIAALEARLHVLVEKPISVHIADAARLLAAHQREGQIFAVMFNQRTHPLHAKIKRLLETGALGQLVRAHWTITTWFRTNAYYSSSPWRATWAGEGGGVLLNQAPHNLDLLCWWLGRPTRVRAHCAFGKHHPIEVEDEVNAFIEFPDGLTVTFTTSTGESPGTNRLEIVGDCGSVVFEHNHLQHWQCTGSNARFIRESPHPFGQPEQSFITYPDLRDDDKPLSGHAAVLANFADAIRFRSPLIAPAAEGYASVELANAMLLSAWLDHPVKLPLDADQYVAALAERIGAKS